VVLQVGADAGQGVPHGDAGARQALGIADPRPLQDQRRADRAGGQDHLAGHPAIRT
jgi:hypothetical protein